MLKTNKIPLSVFIITNEDERLINTVKAVIDWAEEVIIISSIKNNKFANQTEILGCRVIFNEWKGYGPQKIFGEKQCKNDWVLNLDADEVITSDLKKEITQLFTSKTQNKFLAYKIKIVDVFKKTIPTKFAYYYNQTRLYNRQKAGFRNSTVHDSVIIEGVIEYSLKEKQLVGQLDGKVWHFFILSYTQWLDKQNHYSQMLANDAFNKGKKINAIKIILMPLVIFPKVYFLRRYFLCGIDGLIFSYLYTMAKMLKYIKLRELTQK